MLYHAHEMGRAAAMQWRWLTETNRLLFDHPFNPLAHTSAGRSLASVCDVFEDLTRRYRKPAFGLEQTVCDGEVVAVREEIVMRKPFGQIKRFARAAHRPQDPRLLIVAPLSGHFATLLRGTVQALLPDHDVHITDWRDARLVPLTAGRFGLDDYIDYIIDFLSALGPDTHVLAVCQPAVPVLAATALMSEDGHSAAPRSLSLMSGPIDTRRTPTVPNELATGHTLDWFRRHMIHLVPPPHTGCMRPVYPGFLQLAGFVSMNLDRHVDAYMRLYRALVQDDREHADRHRAFYDEYLAVMDLPAEFYLETIQRVFQEHELARGRFYHRGRRVRPEAIRDTALLTIEGENDDITSPGQTEAAHDLCPAIPEARRGHHLQPGVGHYGVFNGRRWREHIAPRLRTFIRQA